MKTTAVSLKTQIKKPEFLFAGKAEKIPVFLFFMGCFAANPPGHLNLCGMDPARGFFSPVWAASPYTSYNFG